MQRDMQPDNISRTLPTLADLPKIIVPSSEHVSSLKHMQTAWLLGLQAYLPSDTPSGLVEVRKEELAKLSLEDGRERQKSDRVYDYQVRPCFVAHIESQGVLVCSKTPTHYESLW